MNTLNTHWIDCFRRRRWCRIERLPVSTRALAETSDWHYLHVQISFSLCRRRHHHSAIVAFHKNIISTPSIRFRFTYTQPTMCFGFVVQQQAFDSSWIHSNMFESRCRDARWANWLTDVCNPKCSSHLPFHRSDFVVRQICCRWLIAHVDWRQGLNI